MWKFFCLFAISSKRIFKKNRVLESSFFMYSRSQPTLRPMGLILVLLLITGEIVGYTWSMSNIERNKITHATNGNPSQKITSFFHKEPEKSSPAHVGKKTFQYKICYRTFQKSCGLIIHTKSQHSFQPTSNPNFTRFF